MCTRWHGVTEWSDITIDNCEFRKMRSAFGSTGLAVTDVVKNVKFTNNKCYEMYREIEPFNNLQGLTYTGNKAEYMGWGSILGAAAAGAVFNDAVITGNEYLNITNRALGLQFTQAVPGSGIVCKNNIARNCGDSVFFIQDVKESDISDNISITGADRTPARHFYSHLRTGINSVKVGNNQGFGPASYKPFDVASGSPITRLTARGNVELELAAAPTTGTWTVGDMVYRNPPATGQPLGWKCSSSGTFEDVGPLAGTAANGSPIVAMADTTAIAVGMYVDFSAKFAVLTKHKVIAVVANTSITVDANANADGATNVSTVNPTFLALANLP